jgi:hypothetical protein
MTTKGNVVLHLDKELVEKSKSLGFNLSKIFENHLKQLTTQFSTGNSQNNFDLMKNKCRWWAGPDSDRRPSARQAPQKQCRNRTGGVVMTLWKL